MTLIFQSCFSPANAQDSASLEGQEWILESMNDGGFGTGKTWLFSSGNRFEHTSWYSGGAYWTHQYKGTYRYDEKEKIIFLEFNANQKLENDHLSPKMMLQLDTSKKDSLPVMTASWDKKAKEKKENLAILNPHFSPSIKFSIRKTSPKNSPKN